MGTRLKLVVLLASLPLIVYLWPSALGGDTEFIAVNGVSMLPTFESGSLAIVKKSPTYEIGDIAVYDSSALNRTVIHRIIAQQGDGFIFKGDNNHQIDPGGAITQDKIHGKVAYIIPYMGYIPQLLKNPLIMAIAVLAVASWTFGKKEKKGKKQKKESKQSFFSSAILINLASYVITQISILSGVTPQGDGFTNYLFKIFDPFIASTIAFAVWIFALIGIRFATQHYQVRSAKRLENTRTNTLQIKEQETALLAGEAFYILLAVLKIISIVGVVKGLVPSL